MAYATIGMPAGLSAATTSSEAALISGPTNLSWRGAVRVGSAAVDAGNTPTTVLRPGLVLAKKTSDGLYYPYDPDATDGTEVPECVLESALNMIGGSGAAENKDASVLIGGVLQAANLITGQNGGLDANARRVLRGQFLFDDELPVKALGWRQEQVATNTTVTAAKTGTLYIATAAVTFTLPTIAHGLEYEFLQTADANLVITGAAGTIIRETAGVLGTTATFSTADSLIGANAIVKAVYVGANLRWFIKSGAGSFVVTMS